MTDATDTPFTAEMIQDAFGADAIVPEGVPSAAPAAAPSTPDTAEKPAESPDPKLAERIAANRRAELKAANERRELETARAKLAEQQAAQEKREAELRLIEEDPAKYFELKKLGTKAIADHLEKLAGTYKPEAVQEKKLTAVEQELADLKKQLADEQAAKAQTEAQRAATEAEKAAGEAWLADVAASADKYPHLTKEWSEEEAVQVAFAELRKVVGYANGQPVTRVAAFTRDNGRGPTHDEIAELLDGIAKARHESRSKATWGKSVNAPTGSQPLPGEKQSAPTVKGSSPRTLSARDTSQRAAAPRSTEWTQERADEESLRILAASMKR